MTRTTKKSRPKRAAVEPPKEPGPPHGPKAPEDVYASLVRAPSHLAGASVALILADSVVLVIVLATGNLLGAIFVALNIAFLVFLFRFTDLVTILATRLERSDPVLRKGREKAEARET